MVEYFRSAVGISMLNVTFMETNIRISAFSGHIVTSGCPNVLNLFANTYCELIVVENVAFATRITTTLTSQHKCKISHLIYNNFTTVHRRSK